MNRSIIKQIKNNITFYNNRILNNKINHSNNNNNNNIIYRYFTNNNSNNNDNDKIRVSKELKSLGVYYPNEEQDAQFTEDYEEEDGGDYEHANDNDNQLDSNTSDSGGNSSGKEDLVKKELFKSYQQLKQDSDQFGNFEEYLNNGKKFQDMIYRIKDNYEQSQIARKRLELDDMDFESFEELEKKIEEKMNKKYEDKEKKLATLTESDFMDYDQSKVQVFNKVSDSFIQAKTHFDTPFEKTEKQLESNEITELPEGVDTMMTEKSNSPIFNKAEDQKNDIASRISKIKQRISKDKINLNRIGGEDMNELFSLYREDPVKNDAAALSRKFNVNQQSLENLLKYTTVPIIVKYNTGLKTGHWNVVFEK